MSKIEAKKTDKKRGQVGKNLGGRPKKEITFPALERLCRIHCTQREICSFFGVDEKTLSARIKEEYGIGFSEYCDQISDNGKSQIRDLQWKSAEKGNVSMQQWLGKCVLGQKENNDTKAEGKNSTKIVLKTRR